MQPRMDLNPQHSSCLHTLSPGITGVPRLQLIVITNNPGIIKSLQKDFLESIEHVQTLASQGGSLQTPPSSHLTEDSVGVGGREGAHRAGLGQLLCVTWVKCFSCVHRSHGTQCAPSAIQGFLRDEQGMRRGPSVCLLTFQGGRNRSILQTSKLSLRYHWLAPIYLQPKTSAQRKNKHRPEKKGH